MTSKFKALYVLLKVNCKTFWLKFTARAVNFLKPNCKNITIMRYNNVLHNYLGTLKPAKLFQIKLRSHGA